MTVTVDGLRTLCITDREDVWRAVKQIHENTIHAFDMASDGEKHPEASAMVAVWARTNADDTRNDYGNTRLRLTRRLGGARRCGASSGK